MLFIIRIQDVRLFWSHPLLCLDLIWRNFRSQFSKLPGGYLPDTSRKSNPQYFDGILLLGQWRILRTVSQGTQIQLIQINFQFVIVLFQCGQRMNILEVAYIKGDRVVHKRNMTLGAGCACVEQRSLGGSRRIGIQNMPIEI